MAGGFAPQPGERWDLYSVDSTLRQDLPMNDSKLDDSTNRLSFQETLRVVVGAWLMVLSWVVCISLAVIALLHLL